jgi:hypothetical protein
MVDGAYGNAHAVVPVSLAKRKLSKDTFTELHAFLRSEAMRQNPVDGFSAPAAYSHWIRAVLHEPKDIAAVAIERFLWHHKVGKISLTHPDDLEFIVGLAQFDEWWFDRARLRRDQEEAVILLGQELAQGVATGVMFGESYGNLIGTKLLYTGLGDYLFEHPYRAKDVCWLIRERNVRNIREMKPLLDAMMSSSLNDGIL